jgi:hypothetical protein
MRDAWAGLLCGMPPAGYCQSRNGYVCPDVMPQIVPKGQFT